MIDLPSDTYYYLDAIEQPWKPEAYEAGIGTCGHPAIDKIIRDHYGIQAPKVYQSQQVGLRYGSPWQEGGWNNDTEWTVHIVDDEEIQERLDWGEWVDWGTPNQKWVSKPSTDMEDWLAKEPVIPDYYKDRDPKDQHDVKDIRSAPEVDYIMTKLVQEGVLPKGHYIICVSW